MKVLELFQDISGAWRARVDIGDESIFLKFEKDKAPTEDRIFTKAQNYIDNRDAQILKEQARETKRLELIADVEAFDENTITKNEAINLAKKLIKNYYAPNGSTN